MLRLQHARPPSPPLLGGGSANWLIFHLFCCATVASSALVSLNDGDPEPSCSDERIREDGDKDEEGRLEGILSLI